MGRAQRVDVPDAVHHVIAKVVAGGCVGRDEVDRAGFLVTLHRVAAAHRWDVLAWCLMDTHVHLLVHCREPTLSQGMGRLLGAYARRFNERHDLAGHFWGERFYSTVVEVERHLVAAAVYVVLNPVRAGIVDHPREHRWCSYRATAGDDPASFPAALLLTTLGPALSLARRRYAELVDVETGRAVRARTRTTVPA